jgi:hypothetical protein
MASIGFTNETPYSTPGAWFLTDADGTSKTATMTGQEFPDFGPDGAFTGVTIFTLLSAVITPTPPSGSVTLSTSASPARTITATVSIPTVAGMGDPGFHVDAIRYRASGGAPGVVTRFDDVPTSAEQIVSYESSPDTHPFYTLTLTVEDTPYNPVTGIFLPAETQVFSLQFGAEPNYNPGRDALIAAVNARR